MLVEIAGFALLGLGLFGVWKATRPKAPTPVEARRPPSRPADHKPLPPSPGPAVAASNTSDALVGTTLGDWEILQRVGEGGMATVYKARSTKDGRPAAVKVIREEHQRNPEFIARFRREIEISRTLHHPGLIEVYQAGQQRGQLFMAVEWLEGPTLESVLQKGALPLPVFYRFAPPMAQALQHAHDRELMHRDIKPGNIMLTRGGAAKVLDFGLAVQEGQNRFTAVGFSMGTPTHMAPEVLTKGVASFQADQYALGIVFYQMLIGECPFTARNPVELGMMHVNVAPPPMRPRRAEIPADLEELVMRMLAKQPEQRFPRLDTVAEMLIRQGQRFPA